MTPPSRPRRRDSRWEETPDSGVAQLACIYRDRHVELVERLVADAHEQSIRVALWALENVAPQLEDLTVGQGPGSRLGLLNKVIAGFDSKGPLVIADDDISFHEGDLGQLLRRVRQARLSIAQPAHAAGSVVNHTITAQRVRSRVRRTLFVEVGPVLVISAVIRASVTPFPEEFGMGWGLDVAWSDLHRSGHRLGIVDEVTIMHHAMSATTYSVEESRVPLDRALAERGLTDLDSLLEGVAMWPRGFPFPVWLPTRSLLRRIYLRTLARVSSRFDRDRNGGSTPVSPGQARRRMR